MIMLRRFLLLLAACLGLASGPAFAQAIDASDRAEIQARVDQFSAAMAAKDYSAIYEISMAPGLRAEFRRRYGVTDAQLREAVIAGTAQALGSGVTLVDFSMDVAGATAGVTPNGRRGYLVIPTQTLMEAAGSGRVQSRNNTLAIEDEGQWYLLRVDEMAQVELLRAAYPDFVGVNFPMGTAEAAD